MSRTICALSAALALLVLSLGSSAVASSTSSGFRQNVDYYRGKNNKNYLQVYFTGTGVSTIRLYLLGFTDKVNKGNKVIAVPSAYLQVLPGTGGYQTLKKRMAIKTPHGAVFLPAGAKYWVRSNPPPQFSPTYGVAIPVKVNPKIPERRKHCAVIYSVGFNRAGEFVQDFRTDWATFCQTGTEWKKPGSKLG